MNYKAQKRIDAVRSGKTDTLDLGNLDLTELPDEVYELTNLRELKVVNYLLMSHQSTIDLFRKTGMDETDELLSQLVELENELQADLLVPKQLQTIDPRISQLRSLEVLNLWCNRIERLPDSIGTLPNYAG